MQSEAQNVQVTVGNGTSNTNYCNIPGYYGFHNSAMLFTPSDLQGMRGEIQDLAFDVSSASGSSRAMKIYLKEVAYAALTTSMHMSDFLDGATLVYDQTNVAVTTGWNTFSFTAPFTYTGTSNLLVMVTGTGCTLSGGCSAYQRYTPASGMAWIYAKDTENIDLNTQTGHPTYSAYRFNTRFAITPDPDLCFAPITPLSSNVLSFSATVSWAHHPYSMTTSEWELQYKPASESDWANATVVPVTDTFANLSNLTSATIYNWRVKTICAAGTVEGTDFSIWTNGSFTTEISCPVPTGVQALSESITTEEAVVVWNPCPQALEYEIQYKEYSINSWTDPAVVSTTVSDTAYLMSGLTNNTYYNFRVRATCDIGNDYSAYATCNVRTACGTAITTLPWSDNFDTYGTGTTVFPACWTRNTTYTDRPYVNTTNHSAPGALYFYASTAGNYNIAAIPPIDESIAMNSLRVKGWYFYSNTTAAIEVGIMTDPTDASTFVNVATFLSTGAWMPFEVPLFSYQGEGHYIAFKTDGAIASGYGYIDDIVVELLPECPDVYNLSVIHGSNNSAKVLWNNSITDAAQSGWILAWDELPAASFDPETATNTVPLTTTDMPHFVQSLTPGSTYSFAMRSACTDGAWSATKTITILGASETVSVPYYEDFEVTDTLSFYSSSSTNKWAIGSATGNPGNSMYISNNNGAANAYTITNTTYASASIIVDFGNLVNYPEYALQFDWKAQGEDRTHDYMRVYLAPLSYTHSGAAWPSGTGVRQLGGNFNLNGSWQHASLPISNDCFGTIQKLLFVWWNDLSVGTQPPAAVDNIAIEGFMCVTPSDIQASDITEASANLTWTSTSPATDWILYYKSVDATTVDSVLVNGTTEYPLANLIHSTDYQVWLKTDCGADGLSAPSLVYTFKTLCGAITSVPWTESFDSYGTGNYANFPPCFSRKNTYSATGYPYISTTNHSAPGALYNYASSAGAYSLSTTPKFDEALPLNTLRLKFWHYAPYTASLLKVGVMSDPADVNTFVELQTYTVSTAYTWEERELSLTNAPDTCHYIAFMTVHVAGGYGYGYIDDIVVDAIPSCPDVYNFAVVMGINNTAIVSWDNTVVDDMESGWIIVYDEVAAADFDPTTAANSFLVTADAMPYLISGLNPGSIYTFAMRVGCGGSWTTPISLTAPQTVSLPYSQDFESLSAVDEFNFVTGSSNAWHTGNLTGNPGNSMYISSTGGTSLDYAANSYQLATASVVIDFGEYAEYNISFEWKGYGESNYDYMLAYLVPMGVALPTVGANNWNGPSNGLQITASGNNSSFPSGRFNNATYPGASTNWQHVSFTVPGSLSGTVQQLVFIFQCDGSGQYTPGACVDNIVVTGTACGSPYNISSNGITQTAANITWQQIGSATNWWLYWSVVGSAVVDSVQVLGTPAYTLTNLAAGTPYSVWLKTNCGVDGISGNSAIHSFNTVCGYINALPYIQDFDNCPSGANVAAFPNCWTRLNNYSSNYYPYVATGSAASGSQSLYWYQSSTNNIHIAAIAPMINPAIDVSALRVKFKMRYGAVNAVGLQVGVLTNPTDYSTFVPIGNPQYITTPEVWEDKEVHLNSYVPTDPLNPAHYIALATFNDNSQYSYFYIDDFVIDSIPSCADVYNFAVSATSSTNASVSWLTTGLGNNGGIGWTIVYAPTTPALFDPTTAPNSVQVTATSMPYTIGGLLPAQTYTFAMRSNCGGAWSPYIQIVTPQGLPYSTDFSNITENQNWMILGNNDYLWSVGTAVGNLDESVYISNDNGTTHAVGSNPTYSYFYRDFDFGSTPGSFNLNFDWLCQGYLSDGVWYSGIIVHVRDVEDAELPANLSSFPTWINDNSQFRLSLYGSNSTWQNVSRQIQNASGVKRILFFYFRTTSSNVPDPGAAIDNLFITPATCIVPAQVSITDLTPQSVNVHWNNTGADSYSFTWRENTTGAIPNTVILTDTVYSFTGLAPSTGYLFNLRANCGTETSPYSTTWILTTPCETTSLPYIENFDSYTGTTYNTVGVVPTCWTSSTTNTDYPAPHITGGGTYHYPHSGTNALMFTAGVAGFDAYAVLPLFDQPVANLSISFWYRYENASYGTLSVGFITGIQSDMSSFTFVTIVPATATLSQFTYDFSTSSADLSNATYIVLRWYQNESYYSCGVDDIEVTSVVTCNAPTNVAAGDITSNSANISWSENGTATEWLLEYGTSSNYEPPVSVTAQLHPLSGLQPNTTYNVRMRAVCGVNVGDTSDYSNETAFTTSTCSEPANVEITGITATTISLTWQATNGENKWNVIWRSTTANSGSTTVENTPATTLTELTPATDYEICVVAICAEGVESAEECKPASTTVIHDLTLANSLQLYPNQTTGELRIKNYELREGDKIEVYNMLGQKQQLTINNYPLTTIDVSHLSAGIYTVKVGGYVGKFVRK
jgi:hypothetical protein